MLPLTRPQTHGSVHSWWSDSNPGLQGPTMNLHAAAKPLMKLMYDRQALGFIQKNRGIPLSNKTMETFSSYLLWKYVSPSTKASILSELKTRASSEADVHTILKDSVVLHQITELAGSTNTASEVRVAACGLLGNLGPPAVPLPSNFNPSAQLVLVLRDKDPEVIEAAVHALSMLSSAIEGATATIDAGVLEYVPELLQSPSKEVRRWSCRLAGNLVSPESTTPPLGWEIPHELVSPGIEFGFSAAPVPARSYVNRSRKRSRREVRVLLLGQSESGKSTCMKREYSSLFRRRRPETSRILLPFLSISMEGAIAELALFPPKEAKSVA
ncbi:hypothetical protein DFH07DRAFT_522715 [Mycena maculata]|uniref:ARM repeat-containing protein n=1 Tax=Mycena maculata TaxID=230809 RepID=A0AAD7IYU3_9AGAR|nr:hypothetical protein DFH07DRAFT_522715 [Mycena maculata]